MYNAKTYLLGARDDQLSWCLIFLQIFRCSNNASVFIATTAIRLCQYFSTSPSQNGTNKKCGLTMTRLLASTRQLTVPSPFLPSCINLVYLCFLPKVVELLSTLDQVLKKARLAITGLFDLLCAISSDRYLAIYVMKDTTMCYI